MCKRIHPDVRDADNDMAVNPTLWRYDRAARLMELPVQQAGAILAVFSAGAAAPPREQVAVAQATLAELRRAKEWMVCGCSSDLAAGRPLLYPRRRQSGHLEIVRAAGVEHARDCPLWKTRRVPEVPDLRSPYWLHGVLCGALQDAGLCQVSAAYLTWEERSSGAGKPRGRVEVRSNDVLAEYKAMEEVIRAVPISADIRLGEVCAWSTRGLPWIARRAAGLPWGDLPPTVYLLSIARLTEGSLLLPSGERIVAPTTPAEWGEAITVYALVAFEVPASMADGTPPPPVVAVALQPMYSRSLLLPVADQRDRRLARALLAELRGNEGRLVHHFDGAHRWEIEQPGGRRVPIFAAGQAPDTCSADSVRWDPDGLTESAFCERLRRVLRE